MVWLSSVFLAVFSVAGVSGNELGRGQLMIAGVVEETLKGAWVIGLFVLARDLLRRLGHAVAVGYLSGAAFGALEIAAEIAIRRDTAAPLDLITALPEVLTIQSGITALTGLGVGVALSLRSLPARAGSVLGGLAAAIGLHTAWDVSSGAFALPSTLRLGVFAGLYLWLIVLLVLAVRSRRRPDRAAQRRQAS